MNVLRNRTSKGITKDIFVSFRKSSAETTGNINTQQPSLVQRKLTEFKEYLKMVANDYKEVGVGILKSCKDTPVRASLYGITIGSFVGLYKTNPTFIDYTELRKQYTNELTLVGNAYNRKTEFYLNSLDKLENANLLEIRSYVFFSLILQKNYGNRIKLYENQCEQLNNPSKYNIFNLPHRFFQFLSRVVDVGAANRFYFVTKYFEDYDIDDREWDTLKMSQTMKRSSV